MKLLLHEAAIESGIDSIQSQQFVMPAVFYQPTVIQNKHLASISNSAESVRDDKACATRQQDAECFLKAGFCCTVDAAGGFVQYQDRWVGQHCSRKTDQLPLSRGQ